MLAAGSILLFPLIFVAHVRADNTCYAPVPVDCTTLSADACNQAHAQYQSEATIYNTCISDNYAKDAQASAVETKIRAYCSTERDTQSCVAAYDACQTNAPSNSFGSPNNKGGCSYDCNSGYYLTVAGSCKAQGVTPPSTSVTTAAPAPAQVTAAPPATTSGLQATVPTTVTKPKSFLSSIIQKVAPKSVSSVVTLATTSATTSETDGAQIIKQVVQEPVQPTSFWQKLGNFFSKLSPLNWFK